MMTTKTLVMTSRMRLHYVSDVGNSMLALETELCYIVDDDVDDGDKDYGGEDDNVE